MPKFYRQKVILIIIGLIAIFQTNTLANSFELKWFNQERKLLIKIDLKTNQVFTENTKNQNFKLIGSLSSNHAEITSLDCDQFKVHEFKLKNRTIISIVGTSLVYQFSQDGKKFHLNRLDQSKFKGYNFYAYQFIRNDTLFSMGGYGFWHYNNQLIYFDEEKGWELYKYKNDGPDKIASDVCGYDANIDGIWTLNLIDPENLNKGNNDQYLYFFDFKTKKWSNKGKLNKDLIGFYSGSIEKGIWIKNIFVFNKSEGCLILDPIKNNLSIVNSNARILANNGYIYIQDDTLYIYRQLEENQNEIFQIRKMNISEFLQNIESINEIAIKTPIFEKKSNWIIGILIVILIIISSIGIKKSKKKNTIFNEIEVAFLSKLLNKEVGISTDELNQYLVIDKKNVDIQKNQRNQFIKNINSKFQLKYNTLENIVERKSLDNDKRFVLYVVNEKYVGTLKSYYKKK